MENALLIGLSRQMTLRRSLDVTANNLANMSTAGFKVERPVVMEQEAARPARVLGGGGISFVRGAGLARDFSTGELAHTGRPLDLAINSDGFFELDANGATQFTRDGRFTLDGDGGLVTASGASVMSDSGGPIAIPAGTTSIVITDSGSVSADGQELGRLRIVRFDDTGELRKVGNSAYVTDAAALPVDQPDVQQGYIENSNVNPIEEITRLIEVTRAYESVTKLLSSDEDLKRKAINKLAGLR